MRKTSQPKPIPMKRVRELFKLDPETGDLVRLVARGRAKAGSNAVRTQWDPRHQETRTVVWIDGEKYQAPRIILSLSNDRAVPTTRVVDHRDGDTTKNGVDNLRSVTRTQNQMNRRDNRGALPAVDLVDPW